MKTRVISGTAYVAIVLTFYLLKVLVSDFFFDALIWFCAIVGTFEILRATKEKTNKAQRITVMIFSIVTIPATAIADGINAFNGRQYGLHMDSILFFVLAVILLIMLVLRHEETSLESVGVSLFSAVYPTLLLTLLVQANHVPLLDQAAKYAFNSDLLICFIFVISPAADCFAFFFGKLFGKICPRKLAPKLSPKKTVVGAIGGLIGGVIGGGVIYIFYNLAVGSFDMMGFWLPVYFVIGFLGAAATMFGDLVESCIKRKLAIKDMGKIMPGHGGVLDRIDGTLFATMAVYVCFVVVRMFVLPSIG